LLGFALDYEFCTFLCVLELITSSWSLLHRLDLSFGIEF